MHERFIKAAEAAYECLIRHQVTTLPVDAALLLRMQPNVTVMTFSQAAHRLGVSLDEFKWESPSPDAFAFCAEKEGQRCFVVCYDEASPLPRRRYALAHELAHILLKHRQDEPQAELEANCFAHHLLCPRPLLKRMAQLASPLPQQWLCQTFGLSPSALRMILSTASPLACDSPLEANLSLQLTQPLSLSIECETQKKLDPSIYLGT